MAQLNICFLFHMHQPWYRDLHTGRYDMPWVRLHAMKGYTDIPEMILKVPEAAWTVNLVPSLIAQLEDYTDNGATDPWLELSRKSPSDMNEREKGFLLRHFFSVNPDIHMPSGSRYRELMMRRSSAENREAVNGRIPLFTDRDFRDIQVLFNLAWFGAAAFDLYPVLKQLKEKGSGYGETDLERILQIQDELMKGLLDRYRRARETGRMELTVSPYYHPILPLLVNTDTARRCMPEAALPPVFKAPEEARWQVSSGAGFFADRFGQPPAGMWPSEGSVSPEVLDIMAESGLKWFATDEEILTRSGIRPGHRRDRIYQPYRFETDHGPITGIFRDRELSDMIGFRLFRMDTEAAVKQFTDELAAIRHYHRNHNKPLLVPVILDGENPWEQYRDSGWPFLTALVEAVEDMSDVRLTTVSDALGSVETREAEMPIYSGSWINGNYGIWIGHRETNAAWTVLGRTDDHLRQREADGNVSGENLKKARHSLRVAQGSDWFWWYGDDFVSDYQDRFDRLFLTHLQNVYRALGDPVPESLSEPIRSASGGDRLEAQQGMISPPVTGLFRDRHHWRGAGIYVPLTRGGAMYTGDTALETVRFGRDTDQVYIRIRFKPDVRVRELTLLLRDSRQTAIHVKKGDPPAVEIEAAEHIEITAAWKDCLDLAIPHDRLGLRTGETLRLAVVVQAEDVEMRFPLMGSVDTGIAAVFDPTAFWVI